MFGRRSTSVLVLLLFASAVTFGVSTPAVATPVAADEQTFGAGTIRIAGSLLPDPTEENFHPYGLASYALTYTGYQVFENLVDYRRS